MKVTLVFELGNSILRLGIAGEPVPRTVVSLSDFPQLDRCINGNFTEPDRIRKCYTEFFYHAFFELLQIKSRDCRVLIVENFFTRRLHRNCLLTSLLKDLQVSSVSMQPDLILPMLTMQTRSAIVVDIGERQCRVIAIAHGRVVMHSHQETQVGVRNAAAAFSRAVSRICVIDGIDAPTPEHLRSLFDRVADCNEQVSAIEVGTGRYHDVPENQQQRVRLSAGTRSRCMSILVKGITASGADDEAEVDEVGGAAGILLECLRSCDSDVRRSVAENIVFCGGGSMIPGLSSAVSREASMRAESDPRYQALSGLWGPDGSDPPGSFKSPFLASSLSWTGGSLFASMKSNDAKFVKLKQLVSPPERKSDLEEPHNTDDLSVPTAVSVLLEDMLIAPDWLSAQREDWTFFGPPQLRDPI